MWVISLRPAGSDPVKEKKSAWYPSAYRPGEQFWTVPARFFKLGQISNEPGKNSGNSESMRIIYKSIRPGTNLRSF